MSGEQVRDLGNGGLNTDLPPMILAPNQFSDCLNVRFDDNAIQAITGEAIYRTLSIAPDYGIHWRRPDKGYNIFAKDGVIIKVEADGTASNMLSSVDPIYDNSNWQGTYFNGGFAVVVNNGTSTPLYCLYGDPVAGDTFQPLPNWNYLAGLTVTAKLVRALNYSLIAANLTLDQSGTVTYAPGTIRVSTQAATGSIPQVWQPGLTTDTADEFELSSTSPILDMSELRGSMYVYSSDSISILSIGSQTRVTPYSKTYGILSTDCVVEFDGKHFVVDRNDIYIHNGSGNIESIADFRIKKYFFDNLNTARLDKVHVTKDASRKEIWINYPKGSSVVCNEALIYQYKNNTWTKRQLANVTYTFNGPANQTSDWLYGKEVLYMTTDSTQLLVSDNNYLMWDGTALSPYTSFIEKKKINTGDLTKNMWVSSLYPVFDKVPVDAAITIRVKGQNNYTSDLDMSVSDPTTKDTWVFLPNDVKAEGYKVDPRVTGRVLNYRIESSGNWRLAAIALDAQPAGHR
jgi:hypothetical protein